MLFPSQSVTPETRERAVAIWCRGDSPSRAKALEEALAQLARERVRREVANREKPPPVDVGADEGKLFD